MRFFPSSLSQPGLGETANVTGNVDTFLVQQMHALAQAIYDAKQRNDKADAQALLDRFVSLANEYRARGAGDMTGTDKFILSVGKWIEDSVTAIPSAISALPTAVGEGLIRAAIPFVVLYVGYLYLTSPRRRF